MTKWNSIRVTCFSWVMLGFMASIANCQSTGEDLTERKVEPPRNEASTQEGSSGVLRTAPTALDSKLQNHLRRAPANSAGIGYTISGNQQRIPGVSQSIRSYTSSSRGNNKAAMAAAKYSKAETASQRLQAKNELRDELSKMFDQNIQKQEAQIKQFQKRLDQMKQKLQKRKSAKDEVVELRLKVLIAEATGLGWSSSSSNNQRVRTFESATESTLRRRFPSIKRKVQ